MAIFILTSALNACAVDCATEVLENFFPKDEVGERIANRRSLIFVKRKYSVIVNEMNEDTYALDDPIYW